MGLFNNNGKIGKSNLNNNPRTMATIGIGNKTGVMYLTSHLTKVEAKATINSMPTKMARVVTKPTRTKGPARAVIDPTITRDMEKAEKVATKATIDGTTKTGGEGMTTGGLTKEREKVTVRVMEREGKEEATKEGREEITKEGRATKPKRTNKVPIIRLNHWCSTGAPNKVLAEGAGVGGAEKGGAMREPISGRPIPPNRRPIFQSHQSPKFWTPPETNQSLNMRPPSTKPEAELRNGPWTYSPGHIRLGIDSSNLGTGWSV